MEPETAPLTVGSVARVLKCSDALVRYLERTGQLRAVRTESGVRLFSHADVEHLAAARRRRGKKAAE